MDNLIKRSIWLYFLLLVGEGALRKWILPGLSDAILIIRDPLVLIIYALALTSGRFPMRAATFAVGLMAIFSVLFAAIAGSPVPVTIYGLRINYLHLPLIFIMADVLDRDDVLRFGRAVLWLTLPIGLLMILQYQAGTQSFLNVGAGGDIGGQLEGAMGKIRPPGPFSFISGPVLWFSLATAYTIYGWTHRNLCSRWLLTLATCMIVIIIPVSISRMLMLSVLLVVGFGGIALLHNPSRGLTFFVPVLLIAIVYSSIGNSEITEAFAQRWKVSTTSGMGDSIFYRYLNQYFGAWDSIANAPFFGHGIGMGSNVGAHFTTGHMGFELAESEWTKIILELGPMLGAAFILYRCWLSGRLLLASWKDLFIAKDSLAWLLSGACILPVISGQWGPPTILGFAVFGAGLTLAAAKPFTRDSEAIPDEAIEESAAGADMDPEGETEENPSRRS